MNKYIGANFLLENKIAEELYHDYASKMSIIDYHNHLPPQQIAENSTFGNLTKLWIDGDHYKWRAMRTIGVSEKYITGDASDLQKFQKWAYTVPYALRNPLYHWTHIELQRYFGISTLLAPQTADSIYQEVNAKLNTTEYSCQSLLSKMNVTYLCTTEDPTDSLQYHQLIAASDFSTKVSTAFRPDNAILPLSRF